ncbi:MAG: hypothetical protein IKG56_04440 [Clostridia bacterium]|nr:hypothetical protein [Clostridia bacterium]
MNSKKIVKIGTALMIIATILMAINVVFALSIPEAGTGGISAISPTVKNVIGVVSFICYAAAVILLVVLGVKFMTASPDGKAEIKKSAVIYVVGAILVFAAGTILKVIQNLGNQAVKTG